MFAENIEDIDFNNIIINEPIKNSVIDHSNFYKVIYSNKNITLNGVFCLFKLNNINIVKDKILLNNNNANNDVLKKIILIENTLFNLSNVNNKTKIYKLYELINNNYIKFTLNNDDIVDTPLLDINNTIDNNSHHFILKISGLWETKENIGITFKIIKITNYLDFS